MRVLIGVMASAVMVFASSAFAEASGQSGSLGIQVGVMWNYSLSGGVATGQDANISVTVETKGERGGKPDVITYGPYLEKVAFNESMAIQADGILVNTGKSANVVLPARFEFAPGSDRVEKIIVSTESVRRYLSAELARRTQALVDAFASSNKSLATSYQLNVSEMVCVVNENSTQMSCSFSADMLVGAEQAN